MYFTTSISQFSVKINLPMHFWITMFIYPFLGFSIRFIFGLSQEICKKIKKKIIYLFPNWYEFIWMGNQEPSMLSVITVQWHSRKLKHGSIQKRILERINSAKENWRAWSYVETWWKFSNLSLILSYVETWWKKIWGHDLICHCSISVSESFPICHLT